MKKSLLLLSALILVGCTAGYKTPIGDRTYAPVPEQTVAILLQFPPDGTYDVIGILTAKGAPLAGSDSVYRKFRKSGADLGADGVVVGRAAMAYRGTLSGEAYTTGGVDVYNNGGGYYSGYYSGTTTYTPPQPMYGLDVNGVAIKYRHGKPRHPDQDQQSAPIHRTTPNATIPDDSGVPPVPPAEG